eukprot:2739610-Rhodomonas_salina.1
MRGTKKGIKRRGYKKGQRGFDLEAEGARVIASACWNSLKKRAAHVAGHVIGHVTGTPVTLPVTLPRSRYRGHVTGCGSGTERPCTRHVTRDDTSAQSLTSKV